MAFESSGSVDPVTLHIQGRKVSRMKQQHCCRLEQQQHEYLSHCRHQYESSSLLGQQKQALQHWKECKFPELEVSNRLCRVPNEAQRRMA
jgi:hypothetical protein